MDAKSGKVDSSLCLPYNCLFPAWSSLVQNHLSEHTLPPKWPRTNQRAHSLLVLLPSTFSLLVVPFCRFRKIDFPFVDLCRYLNDFSKALASEVRILLQEVGKLRDERRALQQ